MFFSVNETINNNKPSKIFLFVCNVDLYAFSFYGKMKICATTTISDSAILDWKTQKFFGHDFTNRDGQSS
jgi:hypothetical protein